MRFKRIYTDLSILPLNFIAWWKVQNWMIVDTIRKYFWYFFVRIKRLHPYNLSVEYRKKQRFMSETTKAKKRRLYEEFFKKYCQGKGIDIGCGKYDKIFPDADGWDKEQGDATYMEGVPDGYYDYVYSSHCLEHIVDHITALRNWARIIKKGGFLIVTVPHRDLYEKKITLPSRWNKDHKRFYLPDKTFPPDTFSLQNVIEEAIGDEMEWVYLKVCNKGWHPLPEHAHPVGEYQIEAVLRKKIQNQ